MAENRQEKTIYRAAELAAAGGGCAACAGTGLVEARRYGMREPCRQCDGTGGAIGDAEWLQAAKRRVQRWRESAMHGT